MAFNYFSKNGEILPVEEATVPLSSIEYAYGFGVYETVRVSNGAAFFLQDHIERIIESAKIIELSHQFSESIIKKAIMDLIEKTEVDSFNIKILLIGGSAENNASLFAMCFNPLFPDKKLYRDGIDLITYEHERIYPHAKTLCMLQSYIAYRKAKQIGAYDSLLINRDGNITEGTRTNFFCIKDDTIFTPPEKNILLGVTRKILLKVAKENSYKIEEKNIKLDDVKNYDGAFISSTSSKIIPIRKIDEYVLSAQPENLRKLMLLFDDFLSQNIKD